MFAKLGNPTRLICQKYLKPQTQSRGIIATTYLTNNMHHPNAIISRYKSKSSKNKIPQLKSDTESELEQSDTEDINDKSTKTLTVRTPSMRLDGLLKSSLNIARNKIDVMFYESKIRVNGEKVLKKSAAVHEGDEIDIIRGISPANDKFLTVARVEVLSAVPKEDFITVKIRRCKSLMIENYTDPWKGTSPS